MLEFCIKPFDMNYASQTLAAIVSDHYQTAPLFEKFNLDFCCKGKQTLALACEQKGLDLNTVVQELEELVNDNPRKNIPFADMEAAQLIQYILIHHHFFVKQTVPQILGYLEKINAKHGDRFPQMSRVLNLFRQLSFELLSHMEKEEQVLFPAINALEKDPSVAIKFKAVIEQMLAEHHEAGDLMDQIRVLTLNYTPPEDTCTTFQLTLTMLKDFEANLHKHVHLENNHLFPIVTKQIELSEYQ
jgi:regulator of cell morphogenesis and NO signaling